MTDSRSKILEALKNAALENGDVSPVCVDLNDPKALNNYLLEVGLISQNNPKTLCEQFVEHCKAAGGAGLRVSTRHCGQTVIPNH